MSEGCRGLSGPKSDFQNEGKWAASDIIQKPGVWASPRELEAEALPSCCIRHRLPS